MLRAEKLFPNGQIKQFGRVCRLEKIPLQPAEKSRQIFSDRLIQKNESSEALELAQIGMFPPVFLKDLLLFSEMLRDFRQKSSGCGIDKAIPLMNKKVRLC